VEDKIHELDVQTSDSSLLQAGGSPISFEESWYCLIVNRMTYLEEQIKEIIAAIPT